MTAGPSTNGHSSALMDSTFAWMDWMHSGYPSPMPEAARLYVEYRAQHGEGPRADQQESRKRSAPNPPPSAFRWSPITGAELAKGNYRPQMLVERTLVSGEAGIIAGPEKCFKTTIGIDLSIALSTGRPFLGQFKVYNAPHRVACLTGEIGRFVTQEIANRVCQARSLDLGQDGGQLLFQWDLPQLSNPVDLATLKAGLQLHRINVVIIEPLYLCLLSGQGADGVRAENMYQMGPLLVNAARTCLEAGATPIFMHHFNRPAAKKEEMPALTDLAYAGLGQFARQWILLGRRSPFDAETGRSELYMNVGGSCGHGGAWAVDVDEGLMADDFSGRRWNVIVRKASDVKDAKAQAADQVKAGRKSKQAADDEKTVLAAIDSQEPAWFRRCRDVCAAVMSAERFAQAVNRLLAQKVIEEYDLDNPGQGPRTLKGLRRPQT